jgi:hypothetical protein
MRSLHEMHKLNAFLGDHACPSTPPACFNSKIAGRSFTKFGMNVMPLSASVYVASGLHSNDFSARYGLVYATGRQSKQ